MPATTRKDSATEKPLSTARQSLKEALSAEQRAREIEANADKIVRAASAALDEARAVAAQFVGLDEQVVKSRLAALKGESGAKSQEELREAQRRRIIAHEEVSAAESTLAIAQSELAEAGGNIARICKVRDSWAVAVISERVGDVIAALQRVEEQRDALRAILSSLSIGDLPWQQVIEPQRSMAIQSSVSAWGLPFGTSEDWLRLHEKISAALTRTSERKDPASGVARSRAYWKQLADAVLADPSAEPASLPTSEDLWA